MRRGHTLPGACDPRRAVLLSALLSCLLTPAAAAQVALLNPIPLYEEPQVEIDGRIEEQFSSHIDAGGRFDALRFEVGLDAGGPSSRNVRLALRAHYTHTSYGFGTTTPPACSDPAACFEIPPWRDVHRLDIAPTAALVLNDHIQILATAPVRWEAEAGSDENGVTAGVIGAVRLVLAEPLTLGLGVGVQNELEDSVRVFPVISLDWRITTGLEVRTTGGPYQGGGARLIWRPQEPVRIELEAGYDRRRFRLRDARSLHPNGIGEYSAVPLTLGFGLRLMRSTRLDVRGGLALAGKLRLEDSSGHTLREERFETAGLIGASLSIGF